MNYLKHKKDKRSLLRQFSFLALTILSFGIFFCGQAFALAVGPGSSGGGSTTGCTADQLSTTDSQGNVTCAPCPPGQSVQEKETDNNGNTTTVNVCCQSGSNPITVNGHAECSTVLTSTQNPPTNGCGSDPTVLTSIDFGCKGDACVQGNASYGTDPSYCGTSASPIYHNPIIDALFSIIQFLSIGVGIVVVASVIIGGIQFTLSRDNPESNQKARARIQASLIALLIFIFAYAILNYLIPAGFFSQ